ncbi:MAG: class I SAM-dependent methyltransferase [Rhodospirillaceae bacterium]|nr:class I SAM-dependent methyltransferase [Rhodospirillaceae bacterium]
MTEYLDLNKAYYDHYGYPAPNVESFIFRMYGRILKFDYGIDGSKHEKLLDFGCGAGSACRYFHDLGFDVYGVDISEQDLELARKRMPKIPDHFVKVDPKPDPNLVHAGGNVDIAISIQTLDFLSDTDFDAALRSIHKSMKTGGFIYASMTGSQCYYKKHSTPIGDGLHRVQLKTDRLDYDICLNFTDSEEDMKQKFGIFKCIYLDYYDSSFRNEGSEFRYTFFGQKV